MTNDIRTYGATPNGSTDSLAAINAALAVGDIYIRNGKFAISGSIAIPSNRTIYIESAEIKMMDSVYKSLFINSDFVNGNENIHIIGDGFAVLNSNAINNYDPDFEINEQNTSDGYNHTQTVFCNVDTFSISGIVAADRTKGFMLFQKCSNATIDNIWIDYLITQRNLGGIIMRHQCNNFLITDIRGRTGDDFMSINCGSRVGITVQIPAFQVGDIHDIVMNDVNVGYSGYRAQIILNGEGNKIYNITMNRWRSTKSQMFCWLGPSGYTANPPATDDTYDIVMDDIIVDGLFTGTPVFEFTDSMKDMTVTSLVNNTDKDLYVDSGGVQENVWINGVEIFA